MAAAAAAMLLLLVVAVMVSARWAVVGMGIVAVLAAAMRAGAPETWAFGVRSRGIDIAMLLALALAAIVLGLTSNLD